MKRVLVFLNGELSRVPDFKAQKSDLLIGVDGGTKHILKFKLKPDLIIGDLDSVARIIPQVPIIQYPEEKDMTDFELALDFCRDLKIKEIIIFGFLGRRLDHMISNLMVIAQSDLPITIKEGNQELKIIKTSLDITGKSGDLISLIPLLNDIKVITKGLKWRLQGETLKVGSSRGVSNVIE